MSTYPLFPKDEKTRRLFPGMNDIPDIQEEPHLVFADADGKIRVGCYFGEYQSITFDLGIVPDEIANHGKDAIRTYAEVKMQALIKQEQERRGDREKRIRELHREYDICSDGITIRGFVKKDKDDGPRADFMKMTMTEPFQLEGTLYVRPQCFADGMSGTRTFDQDGNLLDQEIRRQEAMLLEMYKQEVRRRNKPPAHPALAGLRSRRSFRFDRDDE